MGWVGGKFRGQNLANFCPRRKSPQSTPEVEPFHFLIMTIFDKIWTFFFPSARLFFDTRPWGAKFLKNDPFFDIFLIVHFFEFFVKSQENQQIPIPFTSVLCHKKNLLVTFFCTACTKKKVTNTLIYGGCVTKNVTKCVPEKFLCHHNFDTRNQQVPIGLKQKKRKISEQKNFQKCVRGKKNKKKM